MENKILLQELNLIEELLHLVNTEEEYDDLVARAKEICWIWQPPSQRPVEISPRGLEMIALEAPFFSSSFAISQNVHVHGQALPVTSILMGSSYVVLV